MQNRIDVRPLCSDSSTVLRVQMSTAASRCRKVLQSIAVIVCVATSWVLSTQFSQIALHINKKQFNAPYVLMWFNTAFMVLCYPFYLFFEMCRQRNLRESHAAAVTVFGKRGLCLRSVFMKVIPFLLFWIGANYSYVKSLAYVSASIATSISACNTAMVYILSIFLINDTLVLWKIFSVVFAIGGVASIALGINGFGNLQWLGIFLAVLSATSAAFYKVLFKRIMKDAPLGQVSLFMTCLGLINVTVNIIPAITLPLTGLETFNWNYIPWAPLIGSGILSLTFNFSINYGIAMLHPLVISVGMLLGIPLNAVIDILFRGVPLTLNFLVGAALIFASCVLVILPYDVLKKKTGQEESQKTEKRLKL